MEVLIPDDAFIDQQESPGFSTYFRRRGVIFEGFFIEFAPLEAIGTYYVYFDNLRFESNMYQEEEELRRENTPIELRNEPLDNW